jgi:hypothetical protein
MKRWPIRAAVILLVLLVAIAQDAPVPIARSAPTSAQEKGLAPVPVVPAHESAPVPSAHESAPVPVTARVAATPAPKPTPAVPAEPTEPVGGPCGSNPCPHLVTETCPAGTVAILRDVIMCEPAPPVTTCPPGTHGVLRNAVTCEE